ncbi:Lysine transporter LysE [Azospirillaceae bacterium]
MFEAFVVFFQGFILGLAIAAPVGPIGLLCIRRTLEHGPVVGFATGTGAAIADTIFGAVAAFGMTAAFDFLAGHQTGFRLVGGVFMIIIAIKTFRSPSINTIEPNKDLDVAARTAAGGFFTGLAFTLTNPATILAFIALFAGFGLGSNLGHFNAATLVFGVFSGSASWWLTLSIGVALVRHRISDQGLTRISQGTAVALVGFGFWAIVTALTRMVDFAVNSVF